MRLEWLAGLAVLLTACQPQAPTTAEGWRRHGQAELAALVASGISLQGDAQWAGEGGSRAQCHWQLQVQGEALYWQLSSEATESPWLAVQQSAKQIRLRLAPPGARRAHVYAGALADLPPLPAGAALPSALALQAALRQPSAAESLLEERDSVTQQWPQQGLRVQLVRRTGLLQTLTWQAPQSSTQRVQLTRVDWREAPHGLIWPAQLHVRVNEGLLRIRIAASSGLPMLATPPIWAEPVEPLAALRKDRLWQRLASRPMAAAEP